MRRTPEPELMDDPSQAAAYDAADFEAPHARFITLLAEARPGWPARGHAVDLGCGPGDVTLRYARAHPGWRVTGIDGAGAMLALARTNAAVAGLADRVGFRQARLAAESDLGGPYDAAISNSLLHHLHEPQVLWRSLPALLRPGAPLFLMDLRRPADADVVRLLVETYAADEPQVLRRDFEASLHAAFTPGEIRAQLREAGLAGHLAVEEIGDRHLIVHGELP